VSEVALFLAVVIFWYWLQRSLLPRLGVPT
jgi:hypothetical protein